MDLRRCQADEDVLSSPEQLRREVFEIMYYYIDSNYYDNLNEYACTYGFVNNKGLIMMHMRYISFKHDRIFRLDEDKR